ncbi:MAG: hypothetical protein IJJ59_03475 [Pseudobutyrivibrio sp.]|uniref:hypothetical protein n=1 Tax=Pseudobutyrivibrio sp. TaxID=2014367 RepID=UPI0025D6787E|nr:hypothetical protein [Pseudobutyrivibrio sp.]MBQ6462366.1 hypothetical protein [Pseudobutyrivibrio sp.]MBQ8490859.1 hypothetical protein [Pseudobutyrivibrio sp.]
MINDFLKKYQEELISDKIQLKEDMDLLETKINEENKFLALLEESNESYFKEFTPRDINAKNNEKAAEIKLILEDLNKEMDIKNQQMKFYDGRLVEINALLTNTAVINRPGVDNTLVNNDTLDNSNNYLKNALSDINNYIVLDPYRAKIELEKIISTL